MKKRVRQILTAALLIALAALAMTGCGKRKVDLRDYVTVEFSGYDGYGQAKATLDKDGLLKYTRLEKGKDGEWKDKESAKNALGRISLMVGDSGELSNEGYATVRASYTKEVEEALGAEFSPKIGEAWKVKVSGLKKIEKKDLFDKVSVSFSGYDGQGQAVVVSDDYEFSFALSQSDGLSNGETVTVTVYGLTDSKLADTCAQRYGFVPMSDSREYTVSGLEPIKTVDLFEGYEVSFSGCDGYGKASVEDHSGYGFDYTLSRTEGLANGDTVTLTLSEYWGSDLADYCFSNYGFLPASTVQEYTVSGLAEVGTVDLFEGLEVTAEGAEPRGKISVQGKYDLYYTCSRTEGLSNGDSVTIQVSADSSYSTLEDYCIRELGARPENDTYTYTVEGLTSYMTGIDQIPEELMESMQCQAEDVFIALAAREGVTLDSSEYQGIYFLAAKDIADAEFRNRAYLVYKLKGATEDGSFEVYTHIRFVDLMFYGDGTPYTNLSEYGCPGDSFTGGGAELYGYEKLEVLVNVCFDSQRAEYSVETDMG